MMQYYTYGAGGYLAEASWPTEDVFKAKKLTGGSLRCCLDGAHSAAMPLSQLNALLPGFMCRVRIALKITPDNCLSRPTLCLCMVGHRLWHFVIPYGSLTLTFPNNVLHYAGSSFSKSFGLLHFV